MPRCPRCGTESNEIKKVWNYSRFHVKNVNCGKCNKTFRAYFRQGRLSHTIPSPLSNLELRITEYLNTHGSVREDEIAESLNLEVKDVLTMLSKLEREGVVKSTY